MSKQRFMKIMSWYLIISMVLQMLPINLIAVAVADSGSSQVPMETAVSDEVLSEPDEAESNHDQGLIYRIVSFGEDTGDVMVVDGSSLGENMPVLPDQENAKFVGWTTVPGESSTLFTADMPVTSDLVLYPLYEEVPALRKAPRRSAEEDESETWTVTFYNRDNETISTRDVTKGEAIGELPEPIAREDYIAYWAVGTCEEGEQGQVCTPVSRIDASYIPDGDVIIIPDYDMIEYTVTFYTDDTLSEVLGTRTVNANTSYCLNDIPQVPIVSGSTGKWVYSGGDFSNSVAISENTSVWAEYEKNVFAVTWMADEEVYHTDTYNSGDTLTVPSEPVVEGKQFTGWFNGETEITGGEEVTADMTITAAFENEYEVTFIVRNGDQEEERLSQYFRTEGESIGTLPDDPFIANKVFEKWVLESDPETVVTEDTVVTGNMTVLAIFRDVAKYNITAEYYYLNDAGAEVVFNTDLLQEEASVFPYPITAPATTQTDETQVSGGPIYYPETPTQTINLTDFDEDNKVTVRFKYVPYTAEYDFVYKLKDLEGDGYTEIEDSREHAYGVLNSDVTPTIKKFDYAELESAEEQRITQATGQELVVLYTRKNYVLSYETNGGSYVGGTTAPWGTNVTVSGTRPTRQGYTFAGWYLDEDLTQRAGNTVELKKDTTLYAKWNGDRVNYTIVYMFEKYNDAGTASSFVYDNSRTGSGTVGTTVTASSAPAITRTGWEADTAQNANSKVVIAADGSSVLYVYYKLKTYTFTFDINGSSTNNRYRMTIDGTTYQDGNNPSRYSFTAKLGQDISNLWPTNGGNARIWDNNNSNYFYYWSCQGTNYASKQLIVNTGLIPSTGTSTNVSVSGAWRTNNDNIQVNYWFQNADNDQYTLSEKYSQLSPSGSYSPKTISGYKYDHAENGTDWWGNVTEYNFYYKRYTYGIEYYHGSDKLYTIINVKFGANINTNTYNWTPTQAQCGVDDDYIWGGWYDNSSLSGDPYVFDTMPAGATDGSIALGLYAKWTPPTYTVRYLDEDGTTELYDSVELEKYQKAEKPANPTKDGYVFEGWYTTADGEDLFEWTMPITEDTDIYAHWTRNILSYTVHYVDGDGKKVANDKTVSNPNFEVGQVIEEKAMAVAGYRPDANVKTVTLTGVDSDNVITFVYTKKVAETSYTVKYILDPEEFPEYSGEVPVAVEMTVENVPGDTASVTETAKAVDYTALIAAHPELEGLEFHPDNVQKELVLTANAETNVLVFKYSAFKNAKITVNYVDMEGNAITDAHTEILKVGKTFTLARTPIAGWELNKAVEGTEYSGDAAGSSYKITSAVAADGSLTFTLFYQKKVTVTAVSRSKQYDGEALTLGSTIPDQVKVDGEEISALSSVGFTYTNCDNTAGDGRINTGTCTAKPKDAVFSGHANQNYYTVKYISGTLEVTKINVTIRVEPDRWTGNIYDGQPRKTGFTNGSKGVEDYVIISHEGYKTSYLNQIWDKIKVKAIETGAAGLGYVLIDEKDAGDYTYNISLTQSDLPADSNYSVSIYVRPGRLQILPKDVTITTGSDTKVYDGTPLTKTDGYEVSGIVSGETYGFEVTGKQTGVGSSNNTYSITWAADGNTYTAKASNYNVTTENLGTLTVEETALKITVKDAAYPYDGEEHSGHTISGTITGTGSTITTDDYVIEGLAAGDKMTVNYTPKTGTNAGTYGDGTFDTISIVNAKGDIVTGFYTISTDAGSLTITKIPVIVTITGHTDSKTYDGGEHTASGYDVAINGSTLFTEALITFSDEATASRTNVVEGTDEDGKTDMGLTEALFGVVTASVGNFDVTFIVTDGYQEITPAAVTLTSGSKTREYNGTPLTNDEVEGKNANGLTVETGWVDGEGATYEFTGTITEPDTVTNEFIYTLTEGTIASNYTITKNEGDLTITKSTKELKVESLDGEWTYDGNAHTNQTYKVTFGTETITGTEGQVEFKLSTGDVVTITPATTATITHVAESDVDNAFTWTVEHESFYTKGTDTVGKLEITPVDITITMADRNLVYNGETQYGWTRTDAGMETVTGLVNNETVTINYTPSHGDNMDTYDNGSYDTGTLSIMDGGTVVTEDYKLTSATAGKLTIAAKQVTIKALDASREYDGTALTESGFIVNGLGEDDDHQFKVVMTADSTITNVGTQANVIATVDGVAVTIGTQTLVGNYLVTTADGELEITKAQLKITANKQTYVYNGDIQGPGDTTYEDPAEIEKVVSVEGLKGSDTLTKVDVDGQAQEAGLHPGVIIPSSVAVGNATDNYEISYVNGDIEITPLDVTVTITGNKDTKPYNGREQNVTGYKISIPEGSLLKEVDIKGPSQNAAAAKGTNAGTYPMGLKASDFSGNNPNFNVTFIVEDGELEITKAPLTITINGSSDSKVYNGSAQTSDTTVTPSCSDSQFDAGKFSYSGAMTITETNADSYTEAIDITKAAYADDNLDVTFTAGTPVTFEITKLPMTITITGDKQQFTYDGRAKTAGGYDAEGSNKLFDASKVRYNGDASVSGTNVGTYPMGLIEGGFSYDDPNINVTFIVEDGSLTIDPAKVTVTADDKSKVYGASDPALTATVTGIVAADLNRTASLKMAKSEGPITYDLKRAAGEDVGTYTITASGAEVQGNYIVEYKNGDFVIEPRQVTITIVGNHATNEYDGQAHTVRGYTASANNKLFDIDSDVRFSGRATATRTEVGTTYMNLAVSQFSCTNQNFKATFVIAADGYQEIVNNDVTLTIRYRIYGQAPFDTLVEKHARGYRYNVASPTLEGYHPDLTRVTGTLNEDTIIDVTYYPEHYTLTIHYRYINGLEAAPDYSAGAEYGAPYSVESPVISGWTPDKPKVEGIMPGRNVEITVWYTPEYIPGPTPTPDPDIPVVVVKTLEIDELNTPRSMSAVVNVGDAIE